MEQFTQWPEHEVKELVRMFTDHSEGYYLSHGSIGKILNKSRNAIIAKARRLKLKRDPNIPYMTSEGRIFDPLKPKDTPPSRMPTASARPPRGQRDATVSPDEPSLTPTTLADLTKNVCHFPIGHVGQEGFHFCGAETQSQPYCAAHHKLCYLPPPKRKPRGESIFIPLTKKSSFFYRGRD